MSLYDTGIRPAVDAYLKTKESTGYPPYFRGSSAGQCKRYVLLKRLNVPIVPERIEDASRTTRVFEAGHKFHEWIQDITLKAELSKLQEVELRIGGDGFDLRGHFDDLILVDDHLILYDYKTANSKAFDYKHEMSTANRYQLGTYWWILNKIASGSRFASAYVPDEDGNYVINVTETVKDLLNKYEITEARICQLEKDTLRMREIALTWDHDLEAEITAYWGTLNGLWKSKTLPPCTCASIDGGWFAKRTRAGKVFNDYFYANEPCNIEWAQQSGKLEGWNIENF